MLDLSFKNILESNFFNFLVLISFIFIFIIITKIISYVKGEKKKSEIDIIKEKLNESDNLKNESYIILEQVEEKLENSKKEAEDILKKAAQTSSEFIKKAEDEAFKKAQEIENNGEKTLLYQIQKIKNEIQKEIVVRSIKKAKENIIKKLREDNSLHQKFIDEAIEKIGEAAL